jgi:HEAT repeat protein
LSLRGLSVMLNILPPENVSLDALAEALRSADFNVRYTAAELLASRGDRDARRVLGEVLEHATPAQRASAATHLYRFSWFTAGPLLRQALQDPEPRVRESAVYALCRMRGEEAYALMREFLPSQGDEIKLAAAWGLSKDPDPQMVSVLGIVFQATGPGVQVKALEVLGATGSPEAIPLARQGIAEPDPDVQYAATLSYLELAGEACLPDLAGLITNTHGWSRQAILRGFFHATNYRFIDLGRSSAADLVLDALEMALSDDLTEARLAAAMPLAWMRHPRAEQILARAFRQERDPQTRARMLNVAVDLMSPINQELLGEAQGDPDPAVREMANYLIKRGALPFHCEE